jgi:hypothetical protein
MRRLLSDFRKHDHEVLSWDPLKWREAEAWTRRLPAKTNLVVPRTHLSDEPPYKTSWMGRRRGAIGQYRCHRRKMNLHVKEFPDHWVLHVDTYNPHTNPVQHLLVDHGYNRFFHLVEVLDLIENGDWMAQPVSYSN